MNYRIRDIAPIIGVDADVLLDAARIMGYRRVAGLLCVHGSMSPEFVDEAWRLQKMKDSATARGKKSGAPGFNRYTEGNREPGFRQFFNHHRLFRWSEDARLIMAIPEVIHLVALALLLPDVVDRKGEIRPIYKIIGF